MSGASTRCMPRHWVQVMVSILSKAPGTWNTPIALALGETHQRNFSSTSPLAVPHFLRDRQAFMFGLGCSPTKRDSPRLACHTGGRGGARSRGPRFALEKPKAGPLLGELSARPIPRKTSPSYRGRLRWCRREIRRYLRDLGADLDLNPQVSPGNRSRSAQRFMARSVAMRRRARRRSAFEHRLLPR